MTFQTSRQLDELASVLAPRVTDRDRSIVNALYEHRVLTTQQLYELYFDSLDRARDRLARLHQLHVVQRFRPYRQHGSNPYHYVLGQAGVLLLAAERAIHPSDLDYSPASGLRLASSQQLRHQVEANGIVTRLAHALRATPAAKLVQWRGQRGCARAWGELIRPDSYLHLQLPTGQLELWLEHDRATETHARLQDKLDRYAELALALEQPVTVLVTLTSDRREQELRRALHAPPDVLALTSTIERHHTDPLAANWLPTTSQTRIALTDLPRA